MTVRADLDREVAAIAAEVLRLTRTREELDRIVGRRLAAAWALVRDLDTLRSLLLGRRILARNLDHVALRHALRGGPLPDADAYIEITDDHLDALAEAMPLRHKETPTRRRRR
jgi:hypothetical protein